MTKPVDYYCPHLINTDCILGTLEKEWGSYYEELNDCERFFLLAQVARNLFLLHADGSNIRDGVQNAAIRLHEEIPPDHRLGLIEALCDQLKSSSGI